jgi:hypothetical protein
MTVRDSTARPLRRQVSHDGGHPEEDHVPPRRAYVPYPEYYDGKAFNPRPPKDSVDDIVKQLLLEWTPAGDKLGNTVKENGPQDGIQPSSAAKDMSTKQYTKGRLNSDEDYGTGDDRPFYTESDDPQDKQCKSFDFPKRPKKKKNNAGS